MRPLIMLHLRKFITLSIALSVTALSALAGEPPYKDPTLPVDQRVADLLGRMTLEEKVAQLDMYSGRNSLLKTNELMGMTHARPDAPFVPERAQKAFGNLGIGSIHDLYAYPPLYNAVQKWVIENNRLGIPALFTAEGLHGYMAYDETIFPQSVNLATTWNPDLARAEAAVIASEARADGIDFLLSGAGRRTRPALGPRRGGFWRRPVFIRAVGVGLCRRDAGQLAGDGPYLHCRAKTFRGTWRAGKRHQYCRSARGRTRNTQ